MKNETTQSTDKGIKYEPMLGAVKKVVAIIGMIVIVLAIIAWLGYQLFYKPITENYAKHGILGVLIYIGVLAVCATIIWLIVKFIDWAGNQI